MMAIPNLRVITGIMSKRGAVIVAIAATMVGGACGGEQPAPERVSAADSSETAAGTPLALDESRILPTATVLGGCPPELETNFLAGEADHEPFPGRVLRQGVVWYAVSTIKSTFQASGITPTTTPQDRSVPVDLVGATKLTAETPSGAVLTARLFGPSLDHTLRAAAVAKKLYVALNDASQTVELVVAADDQGRIAFVGQCEVHMATVGFANYLKTLSEAGDARTSEQVLTDIARSPKGQAATALLKWAGHRPQNWIDLPPDQRAFDPDAMPEDLLNELSGVTLQFDFPAEWRNRHDVTLCTRTPQFWGDCTMLDVDAAAGPIQLQARTKSNDPLEIWFLDGQGSFDQPVGRLHILSSDTVAAAVKSQRPMSLRPAPGVDTISQLLDRAASGQSGLTIVP